MTTHTTVVPRLVIAGADQAIDFYQRALGADLTSRYTAPDGSEVHAELRVGDSLLTVKDEDRMDRSATTLGGSPVIFMLVVDDADTAAASLEQAGATVVIPVSDTSYGYRQGRLADPFGYQWMVSQDIEELTKAQTQERLDTDPQSARPIASRGDGTLADP